MVLECVNLFQSPCLRDLFNAPPGHSYLLRLHIWTPFSNSLGLMEVLDTSMLNSSEVSISPPDVPSTSASFRSLEVTHLHSSKHCDSPEPPRICSAKNDGKMSLVRGCHYGSVEMLCNANVIPAEGQVILPPHFRPLLPSPIRTRLVKSSNSFPEIRKR